MGVLVPLPKHVSGPCLTEEAESHIRLRLRVRGSTHQHTHTNTHGTGKMVFLFRLIVARFLKKKANSKLNDRLNANEQLQSESERKDGGIYSDREELLYGFAAFITV